MAARHQLPEHGEIVDIGGSDLRHDISAKLAEVLSKPYDHARKPTLPDELLYDEGGELIWNRIIKLPSFYQTHDETTLLQTHGNKIAAQIQPGVTIIDLGAGDTRKVDHLLQAFEVQRREATYLALDISQPSLAENIKYLAQRHEDPDAVVRVGGIWGTFEDGDRYAQQVQTPRLFLSLGSVLCNDEWDHAVKKLAKWSEVLRPDDLMLVGMDGHLLPKDKDKIWAAYHSDEPLFREFFENGLRHANRLAGEDIFQTQDWEFMAQLEEQPTTRHRFYFRAKRDVSMVGFGRTVRTGEELDWFDSHKYGEHQVRTMCSFAQLEVIDVWQAPNSEFRQYLLRKHLDDREDADSAVSGVN